jgi:hypothetical protein
VAALLPPATIVLEAFAIPTASAAPTLPLAGGDVGAVRRYRLARAGGAEEALPVLFDGSLDGFGAGAPQTAPSRDRFT